MSDKPLVVFARRDPSRVGRLLSKPGKSLDVRWEDGSTETVVSGEFLQAPLGSSRFIQHVLPERWQELWSQDESAADVLMIYADMMRKRRMDQPKHSVAKTSPQGRQVKDPYQR